MKEKFFFKRISIIILYKKEEKKLKIKKKCFSFWTHYKSPLGMSRASKLRQAKKRSSNEIFLLHSRRKARSRSLSENSQFYENKKKLRILLSIGFLRRFSVRFLSFTTVYRRFVVCRNFFYLQPFFKNRERKFNYRKYNEFRPLKKIIFLEKTEI